MELQSPFRAISASVDGDVLQVLASSNDTMTVSRLAAMIPQRSGPGIRLAADRLVEQGVLLLAVTGRTRSYALNDEHLLSPSLRAIAGAKGLLLERLRTLTAEISTPVAALFGSATQGTMRADSDIDILVVRADDVPDWNERLDRLASAVTRLTGNDARIVDPHIDDLGTPAYEPLVSEILRTGIIFRGDRRVLTEAKSRR